MPGILVTEEIINMRQNLRDDIEQQHKSLPGKSEEREELFGDALGRPLLTMIKKYCAWYVGHVRTIFPTLVHSRYGVRITKAGSRAEKFHKDFRPEIENE